MATAGTMWMPPPVAPVRRNSPEALKLNTVMRAFGSFCHGSTRRICIAPPPDPFQSQPRAHHQPSRRGGGGVWRTSRADPDRCRQRGARNGAQWARWVCSAVVRAGICAQRRPLVAGRWSHSGRNGLRAPRRYRAYSPASALSPPRRARGDFPCRSWKQQPVPHKTGQSQSNCVM
eukprot:322859-Prorocentrum_minimum.AAC.5